MPGYYGFAVPGPQEALSEEEVERQSERARESQRRQAVQELIGSGAMLLIAAPVYLYHWRRVQEEASAGRTAPRGDVVAPEL